jgi:zinc protease
MRNIRIDTADLEAERTVVLNEHDQYAGDPLEKLNQAVWRTAFASHPYGAPVLGNREDIRAFTRDGLFEHYNRHYWPGNATVTVIGDLGRELALDIVGRHFGRLPASGSLPAAGNEPEPEQRGERRVVVEQAGQSGWIMLAYKAPGGLNRDADALELLGSILVGGKLSRLYRQLVVGGLATAAWPGTSRLAQPGLFQVQALLGSGQDHQRVEWMVRDAIDSIRIHGVSQGELDRARGRARGNLLTSRDGPIAVAMQLNEAIAAGDWMAYPMAIERLDAVSVSDVQRVARQYLADDALTVGYLVDPDGKNALRARETRANLQ